MNQYPAIPPGQLWQNLRATTARALATGALKGIETHAETIENADIAFRVRVAVNLQRKQADKSAHAPNFNPFLPPERELTLGALGPEHLAVLNKFNVLAHHLLIVTRHFEDQRQLLNANDFAILLGALGEYPSLGFYNGGTEAGASQRHKHLQVVPLPLYGETPALPIAPLLEAARVTGATVVDGLPYPHRIAWLADPSADTCEAIYRRLFGELGLPPRVESDGLWQDGPYNLLMTREWMLLVPRRQEHWEGVSVNALGFAGSLFVRNTRELEAVRRTGPAQVLRAVCPD